MDPNSGRLVPLLDNEPPPEGWVRIEGKTQDVERIAAAVEKAAKTEAERRKRKAAKAARKKARKP